MSLTNIVNVTVLISSDALYVEVQTKNWGILLTQPATPLFICDDDLSHASRSLQVKLRMIDDLIICERDVTLASAPN
jgi:hypothetical protein